MNLESIISIVLYIITVGVALIFAWFALKFACVRIARAIRADAAKHP